MSNFIELIEKQVNYINRSSFIEQAIKLLFNAIAETEHLEDAELLFKNLEDIQCILAKAVFKDRLTVTPFLRNFVYDYDRIDDIDVKKSLYKKIKSTMR